MAQYLGTSHLFRGDSITIETLSGNNGEIVTLDNTGKLLASTYTLGGAISGAGNATQIASTSAIVTWVNAQAFLTSETDTLQTVTNRGASTTHSITTGGLTTTGNVVVGGDLTVNGTVTTIDTVELKVSDNIITLNNDVIGTPTENAGMEVERGTSANVDVIWNEANDRWTFTNDGTTHYNIPLPSEYDNYGSWQLAASGTAGQTAISSNETVTFATGGGLLTTRSGNTISYTHANASWGGMSALTGANVISDVNIDTYGHVSGVSTRALTLGDLGYTGPSNPDNYGKWELSANGGTSVDITSGVGVDFSASGAASISRAGTTIEISAVNTTYTAGSGLSLSGTVFSHANTSSVSTVSLSGLNVLTGLTFDTYGHVTATTTTNITEAVQDTVGSLITAGTDITVNYNDAGNSLTISHANTSSLSGAIGGSISNAVIGVTVDGNGHVTATSTSDLTSAFDNYNNFRIRANSGTAVNVNSNDLVSFVAGTNMTVSRSGTSLTFNATADARVKTAQYADADFTSGVVTFTHNLGTEYVGVTLTLWNTTSGTGEVIHGEVTVPNSNSVTIAKGITLASDERIRVVVIGA